MPRLRPGSQKRGAGESGESRFAFFYAATGDSTRRLCSLRRVGTNAEEMFFQLLPAFFLGCQIGIALNLIDSLSCAGKASKPGALVCMGAFSGMRQCTPLRACESR